MKICFKKLDLLMARLAMSDTELAGKIGASRQALCQLRRRTKSHTKATIGKIANALGVDVLDIIEDD